MCWLFIRLTGIMRYKKFHSMLQKDCHPNRLIEIKFTIAPLILLYCLLFTTTSLV